MAEIHVMTACKDALIIRSSAFFEPWDKHNFVYQVVDNLIQGQPFSAAKDIIITPTYVPDLVHTALDLLTDGEKGIWHITNSGLTTWADFAKEVADIAALDMNLVHAMPSAHFHYKATRPVNIALESIKGIALPHWKNALGRYFSEQTVHPEMHSFMQSVSNIFTPIF